MFPGCNTFAFSPKAVHFSSNTWSILTVRDTQTSATSWEAACCLVFSPHGTNCFNISLQLRRKGVFLHVSRQKHKHNGNLVTFSTRHYHYSVGGGRMGRVGEGGRGVGSDESLTETFMPANNIYNVLMLHTAAKQIHFYATRADWNHVRSSTGCYLKNRKKGKEKEINNRHETSREVAAQTNNTSLWWRIKRLHCLAACDGGKGPGKKKNKKTVPGFTQKSRKQHGGRPDGANCRLTAHMNSPESAVGLVHSRQSVALRQITRIQSQSPILMATTTAGATVHSGSGVAG